jgi:hypothetical protein
MFPARPLLPYGAVPAGSGERWPGGAVPPVSSRNGGYLSLNQRDVGKDAVAPAVESQDPVEDPLPVAAADRQDDRGDQRENGDQASAASDPPRLVPAELPAPGEDRRDQVRG